MDEPGEKADERGPARPDEALEAGGEVRSLPAERYDEARTFALDQLGEPGAQLMVECIRANPDLVLAYEDGEGHLIGLCFGMAREVAPTAVVLQGIAIRRDITAQGRGRRLLDRFEQVVASLGYTRISVGSADGYVERFYLNNGYVPTGYLVCLPTRDGHQLAGLDITRVREERGQVLVNIRASGPYDRRKKKALQEKLGASGVSIVLEKELVLRE